VNDCGRTVRAQVVALYDRNSRGCTSGTASASEWVRCWKSSPKSRKRAWHARPLSAPGSL